MIKKILFIGTVWPEPTSSAAGTRIIQLVQLFFDHHWEIHFATTAKKSNFSADLSPFGVEEHSILLNNASFDTFIKALSPDCVIYDRFMIEEQFGWRIRENCPKTLQILDTEDLHFLRYSRQKLKKKEPTPQEMIGFDFTQRELASIYRSDLSLLISPFEKTLLEKSFAIPSSLLHHLPFLEKPLPLHQHYPALEERAHFVFIGNFLHAPNWQSIKTLKEILWPKIRKELPHSELHIYGAYSSKKVDDLHNVSQGFIIKGRAKDAIKTIAKYKVLLAPLDFGAGIKGKLLDACKAETPFVTTEIGVEGLSGFKSTSLSTFHQKAIDLYTHPKEWERHQKQNKIAFSTQFNSDNYIPEFIHKINTLHQNLKEHRLSNTVGTIICSTLLKSTKYMSLWIEEKENTK